MDGQGLINSTSNWAASIMKYHYHQINNSRGGISRENILFSSGSCPMGLAAQGMLLYPNAYNFLQMANPLAYSLLPAGVRPTLPFCPFTPPVFPHFFPNNHNVAFDQSVAITDSGFSSSPVSEPIVPATWGRSSPRKTTDSFATRTKENNSFIENDSLEKLIEDNVDDFYNESMLLDKTKDDLEANNESWNVAHIVQPSNPTGDTTVKEQDTPLEALNHLYWYCESTRTKDERKKTWDEQFSSSSPCLDFEAEDGSTNSLETPTKKNGNFKKVETIRFSFEESDSDNGCTYNTGAVEKYGDNDSDFLVDDYEFAKDGDEAEHVDEDAILSDNYSYRCQTEEKDKQHLQETPRRVNASEIPEKFFSKNKRKQKFPRKSPNFDDVEFKGAIVSFQSTFKNGKMQLIMKRTYCNIPKLLKRPKRRDRRNSSSCSIDSGSEAEIKDQLQASPPYQTLPLPPPLTTVGSSCTSAEAKATVGIKQCASCGTRKTPLWRDAEDGTPLCNACGIRYKKYRIRCVQCWRIPRKDTKSYPKCCRCDSALRFSLVKKNV